MSEEYYKVIDDIFNPVRKEYKHEFYCKECANIGSLKSKALQDYGQVVRIVMMVE